jgi:hypothetical protein
MSFNHIVVDKLVPDGYADLIEGILLNMEGWCYNKSASAVDDAYDKEDLNIIDSPQFTHVLFDHEIGPASEVWQHISPIVWFVEEKTGLKVSSIFRVKANLTYPTGTNENNYNPPHIDHGDPNKISMVYYVNDSDGDTRIFDNFVEQDFYKMKMVVSNKPKKGSAIIFPSTRFHCSSNPVKNETRIVLNFVFDVEDRGPLSE